MEEQMNKATILIAEDEQYTRDTLSFVLENAGYQVVETSNGKDALHLILHHNNEAEQPIDLMILDIEMSGLTGWQVLDELQQRRTVIPTIIITGLTDDQSLQNREGKNGLEYLKKPFTPDSLISCVSDILKKKHT
jgi:CheY-like chemotaxis protein